MEFVLPSTSGGAVESKTTTLLYAGMPSAALPEKYSITVTSAST